MPRVLVNRVWLHLLGRGLVGTPSDFGSLGERPSHPELLDALSAEFVAHEFSLKWLIRNLVRSRVYLQSSQVPAGVTAGEADRWYARAPVRRLDAESLRDRILWTSGDLVAWLMYGPAVPVSQDDSGQVVVNDTTRRSVYIQCRRSQPMSLLAAFDFPTLESHCPSRVSSTVAPQSLMLLNSVFVVQQSERFAARVVRESGDVEPAGQVARAWELAYGRPPDADEVSLAVACLEEQSAAASAAGEKEPKSKALACLCLTLLNSNEFIYVD